jgi:hypothetical protein
MLHHVSPTELMDESERISFVQILFDLPWERDLVDVTSSTPAVLPTPPGGSSSRRRRISPSPPCFVS